MREISIKIETATVSARPRKLLNSRIVRRRRGKKMVYRKPWTFLISKKPNDE